MKQMSYILVPGLGDHKAIFEWFYSWVARRWTRKGMVTTVFEPRWVDAERYEAKYQRLLELIQKQEGRGVVLVGVSAGAALSYLAFAERRGAECFVSVCGFTQLQDRDRSNPQLMCLSWYQAADAAQKAGQGLSAPERRRILSFIPRSDSVINPKQQFIDGAQNIQLKSRGHLMSIVVTLLWHRRQIKAFATSRG
jgi:hypothetical protein